MVEFKRRTIEISNDDVPPELSRSQGYIILVMSLGITSAICWLLYKYCPI